MMKDELRNAPVKEKRNLIYVAGGIVFAFFLIFVIFKYESLVKIVNFVYEAFSPFLTGLVIAFILNAFVNMFEKRIFAPLNRKFAEGRIWNKIRRPITLILSYVLVIAIITLLLFFIIPEFTRSLENFITSASETVPGYIETADKFIRSFIAENEFNVDLQAVYDKVSANLQWDVILDKLTKIMSNIAPKVVNMAVSVASGIFTVVLAIIYSIYFLVGKEKLIMASKKSLYAIFKKGTANKISMVMRLSNNVFSSYVVGQLTECVILGTLCYIGMVIIGLDYALLISVIIMISALIPILGAYIGAGLGALILLMVHPLDALWFLVFIIILQQFEGNVIYPKVVGSSIGLPGLWTLTAVMVCNSMFGIVGILIGVPATAVVYRLVRYGANRKLAAKGITEDILMGSEVEEHYAEILSTSEKAQPENEHEDEEDEEEEELHHGFFAELWYRISSWFSSLFHKAKH